MGLGAAIVIGSAVAAAGSVASGAIASKQAKNAGK